MQRPDEREYQKLTWLLERLSRAEDYCRPYFDRAKRYYRLYRFGTAVNKDDWPYVNMVRTRDILAFVEDSTASMVQTLFGTEPFYTVQPRRISQIEAQYGIDAGKIAKQMEICLDHQFLHEDAEFLEEIVDFFKMGAIMGSSYMSVFPRFDQQNQYVGPMFKTSDYWDVLPVTMTRRMSKAKGVFIREWMSQEDAAELAARSGVPGMAERVKDFKGLNPSGDEWHRDLLAEVGIEQYEIDKSSIEMIHYVSGGHIITMANRAMIVRDSNEAVQNALGQMQVVKPFPYDHPEVQYKYMPVPLEWFGMGVPEVLESLQEDKNLIRSARRDNIDLVIQKVLKMKPGAEVNLDLIKYYPGAIWPDAMGNLEPVDMGDVTQSAYLEEDKVRFDMENALSMFGYARGQTPTHEERPTTVIRLQQASMNRLDLNVKLSEYTVLRNIATRVIMLTRRFMKQEDYEAIIGEPDAGFYKLSEEAIRRFYMIKPLGSSITKIKEVRQQQLQTMALALEKVAPVAMSGPEPFQINWYQATRPFLEEAECKNIDQILVKVPPQAAQQQMMQAKMEQLQAVKYGEDVKAQATIAVDTNQGMIDMAIERMKMEAQRNAVQKGKEG